MKITAKILADSVHGLFNTRLTTLELRYPRYIHAEFMTHRVFSRNASSSRAIPIQKQIDAIESDPVFPLEWGTNKPGMQAGEALDTESRTAAENEWQLALNDAIRHARVLKGLGVHKQIVNRILEPFAYITVIVTATDWQNFFDLRISPLSQPEIQDLAKKIRYAMDQSIPTIMLPGQAHLPFVTSDEKEQNTIPLNMMLSAARCARVSYLTHDGLAPDTNKDLALAERLRADRHASVFEHQAQPREFTGHSRNFKNWFQHRDILGL